MLQWFRRCLDAERLVQADAEALIRDPQRESGARCFMLRSGGNASDGALIRRKPCSRALP
jgi:hypothetical protein